MYPPQTLPQQLDELRNLVVQLWFPKITQQRRLLFEGSSGLRGEEKDKFLDLAVFFHLPLERVHRELIVKLGHCPTGKLVGKAVFGLGAHCERRSGLRRILAHSNLLQTLVKDLEKLFREFNASISVTKHVADGKVGQCGETGGMFAVEWIGDMRGFG